MVFSGVVNWVSATRSPVPCPRRARVSNAAVRLNQDFFICWTQERGLEHLSGAVWVVGRLDSTLCKSYDALAVLAH